MSTPGVTSPHNEQAAAAAPKQPQKRRLPRGITAAPDPDADYVVVEDAFYERVGLYRCSDGVFRPSMAQNPEVFEYFDNEWGRPGREHRVGEKELFAFMCLLIFQAGMRWSIVLERREQLAAAFANFDPDILATWDEEDYNRVMQAPGVIRNPRKIKAILCNAQTLVDTRKNFALDELFYEHIPYTVKHPFLIESCAEAKAFAKVLRSYGFRFFGDKTSFALMHRFGLTCENMFWREERSAHSNGE